MQNNKIEIPFVDQWKPGADDVFFTHSKDIIMAPISKYYKYEDNSTGLNYFWIKPKKSYNSDKLREHCCHYLNYFERYFDDDKEYFTNLALLKFLIDCYQDYNIQNFIYDINRYIIQPSLIDKIAKMVNNNY